MYGPKTRAKNDGADATLRHRRQNGRRMLKSFSLSKFYPAKSQNSATEQRSETLSGSQIKINVATLATPTDVDVVTDTDSGHA